MFLSKVEISGFRNLEHAELRLNSQFNYIYGENGAGKTALLEAVCTLSRGRSILAVYVVELTIQSKLCVFQISEPADFDFREEQV
ncbi:MAG: AAA family ATPase [Pseudomonadales bacterium]